MKITVTELTQEEMRTILEDLITKEREGKIPHYEDKNDKFTQMLDSVESHCSHINFED